MKATFVCIFVFVAAGLMSAQVNAPIASFTQINPGPCDFSNQFYNDNGLDSSSAAELNSEPDGRFGTFRQTGPPATGSLVNWVADSTNCAPKDPTRRNFRILATTGGNSDDGNSPFSCADQGGAFATPPCAGQPGIPETVEFISILAFIHNQNAFIGSPGAPQQPVDSCSRSCERRRWKHHRSQPPRDQHAVPRKQFRGLRRAEPVSA